MKKNFKTCKACKFSYLKDNRSQDIACEFGLSFNFKNSSYDESYALKCKRFKQNE